MEEEYTQGTRKRKLQLVGFMIIIVVFSVLLKYFMQSNFPSANTESLTTKELYVLINDHIYGSIYIHILLFVIYSAGAIYCYRFGRRIHINRQYPPPGAEMPFTTKISRGSKALIQAYAMYFITVILILYGLFGIGLRIYVASSINGG